MRITGGTFRNRPLTAPPGDAVRPASDKVRAAVFNILMHRFSEHLEETHVLDLFCGAGSYGLEALSRGAATCTFVDHSRISLRAAEANAARLECLSRCRFVMSDARQCPPLPVPPALVFLDPPYATSLLAETLPRLVDSLAPGAVIVCETARDRACPVPDGTTVVTEKTYGLSKIVLLTKG